MVTLVKTTGDALVHVDTGHRAWQVWQAWPMRRMGSVVGVVEVDQ